MASMTLKEAAEAVGVSKSTIWRAVKSGRLSASRDGSDFAVDPAELHRVFQPQRVEPRSSTQTDAANVTHEADATRVALAIAEERVASLHVLVEELRRARDSWQGQAERLALQAPIVTPAPVVSSGNNAPPRRASWFGWRRAE